MIYYADKNGRGDFALYLDKELTRHAGYVFIGKDNGHLAIGIEIKKGDEEENPCGSGHSHHKCVACERDCQSFPFDKFFEEGQS